MPGASPTGSIAARMRDAYAVVVVIGPRWRLDDFMRIELVAALDRGALVIPVLVAGAHMPASHELPPQLAPLTRAYGVELTDRDFDDDVSGVVALLQRPSVGASAPEDSPDLESMLWQAARAGIVPAPQLERRPPAPSRAVEPAEPPLVYGHQRPHAPQKPASPASRPAPVPAPSPERHAAARQASAP